MISQSAGCRLLPTLSVLDQRALRGMSMVAMVAAGPGRWKTAAFFLERLVVGKCTVAGGGGSAVVRVRGHPRPGGPNAQSRRHELGGWQ